MKRSTNAVGGVNLSGNADFSKTTARAGIAWNYKPNLGFYASWGQGFLPPATEELANNPDSLGGFNQHLRPATSRSEEIGARGPLPGYDATARDLLQERRVQPQIRRRDVALVVPDR